MLMLKRDAPKEDKIPDLAFTSQLLLLIHQLNCCVIKQLNTQKVSEIGGLSCLWT